MKSIRAQDLFFRSPSTWVLIDVRSPIEFNGGHFPGSVNLPLMSDEERHQVGLCYRQSGREKAIELGHLLVSGVRREGRLQSWVKTVTESHRNSKAVFLTCARGGLRSKTVQSWLFEFGLEIPLIEGGYKSLRQLVLETLEAVPSRINWQVIGGRTGTGKTEHLRRSCDVALDLEDLAKHRGSAFGALEVPQPNQQTFENALALRLQQLSLFDSKVWVEAESRTIGQIVLPETLFQALRRSPRLELEADLESRVERILREYIIEGPIGKSLDPQGFQFFKDSVSKIRRKLGDQRALELLLDLEEAQRVTILTKNFDVNRVWIRKLLEWYYDPLYTQASVRWKKDSGS